jgi:hypothetical protein
VGLKNYANNDPNWLAGQKPGLADYQRAENRQYHGGVPVAVAVTLSRVHEEIDFGFGRTEPAEVRPAEVRLAEVRARRTG